MKSELFLNILPSSQARVWKIFLPHFKKLDSLDFYLAGGTALALQIGHRCSVDFDFFSRTKKIGPKVRSWLERFPDFLLRDFDLDTIHGELHGVKISFIGAYRYPCIHKPIVVQGVKLADISDLALMKLLALTHRAAIRDYIDLAAILRDHMSLQEILNLSQKKYSKTFNALIVLKSLISFEDISDPEDMPLMFDKDLSRRWKIILKDAVKRVSL